MEDIKLQINKQDLYKRLKTEIKGSNSDIIANAIVDTLESDQEALGKIFMASLGIEPADGEYKEGQKVLVEVGTLSDWMFDKEKMTSENMITKDELMAVDIIKYNKYTSRYTVQYQYIKSDDSRHIDKNIISHYSIQGLLEDWYILTK